MTNKLEIGMELNPEQLAAATHDSCHVLVLAGAGTGKTRTIIARAAHLIRSGVKPQRLLLLTFTRRAAREMTNRLSTLLGDLPGRITAGTFHHFCLLTMRRMPGLFGIGDATVIDRDDQIQLMKLIRGGKRRHGDILPRAGELVRLCSYARNTNQSMEVYLHAHTEYDEETISKICDMAVAFDKRKKENRYLDYDDILYQFAKKLHASEEIRERVRGYYDHILVDEMQDTNPLQWLILDGMRDPAQLFCVGDDAQSIYAFRGADFRNVHSFTQRVSNAVVLRLDKNYRSTQGVLDLSNWLLSKSPLTYQKNLQAHRKTRSTPFLIDFDNEFDEARWIAEDIVERHGGGTPWNDIMIITRTGYGARAVESLLVEKKIPYRFVGGVSLLHAAHVKDLFSLIRSAASLHDELAWARYLTLWPRIGDVTATRIISVLRGSADLEEGLLRLEEALKGRKDIIEGITQTHSNWQDPETAIREAARFLTPILKNRYDKWEVRRKDYELLARLAENYRSLLSFVETYTLDPITASDAGQMGQEEVVTLTTAHSAKGTEAPLCYLIRIEPGMYPHTRSMGDLDQEEEERRILYVAMTRAQDELILTRSYRQGGFHRRTYGNYGNKRSIGSDYFLEDLDDRLVVRDVNVENEYTVDTFEPIQAWRRPRWYH
jgi:DNA helicase-2/ATP-dependent DNA helicase PcrA